MADDFDKLKNNRSENDSDSEPSLPLRLDLLDDAHSHIIDENRLGNHNCGSSGKNRVKSNCMYYYCRQFNWNWCFKVCFCNSASTSQLEIAKNF